jgi:ABC-type multidrug transport system ATPase subunit
VSGIEWVELRGVTVRFGSVVALRGVSRRFVGGSTTVVVGPNGSGKSTLLGVLGTLGRPAEGSVWYEPYGDGVEEGERVRRELGWVGHELRCYPDLTARENVELAARLRGLAAGDAWAGVAERLGLGGFGARRVRILSRGQRQRVSLGCALVHEPSLILLDEAWSGLDGTSAGLLEGVVREQARRGAVVVVVSHDEGLAERLGAEQARLAGGRWVDGNG